MDRADTPAERMTLLVEQVASHRSAGGEVVFTSERGRVVYGDRLVHLELTDDERQRLDDLLGRFHVFKVKQPETRKAPDGAVYVSAKADAKHAADFLEGVFRLVFEEPGDYELRIVE